MLPIIKEYLKKQEDIEQHRNEYRNVQKEISVVDRVVSNIQEERIEAAQRVTGMDSQGMAQQGDSLSSW